MSLVRGWTLTRAWDAGRAGTLTLAIKQAWVGRAGNSMQRDKETDDQMDRKRPFWFMSHQGNWKRGEWDQNSPTHGMCMIYERGEFTKRNPIGVN